MSMIKWALSVLVILNLVGCAEQKNAEKEQADRLSVAKVQREIKIGMSSDDVVRVLGSPNIVTTDSMRREHWVYDKVSTEQAYSNSSGGLFLILAHASGNSGSSSSNQRTLTIIIKFDNEHKVRDFAYHTSSF
jgi:outer membrane protein assembly factor BamE (lipoprotein component of BamABCDE complex)